MERHTMPETYEVRRLSLEEFMDNEKVQSILGEHFARIAPQINGGTFAACHKAIFEATGIFVPELVPVFQRLDAALAMRNLQPSAVRQ
jgi:hypothetical protein